MKYKNQSMKELIELKEERLNSYPEGLTFKGTGILYTDEQEIPCNLSYFALEGKNVRVYLEILHKEKTFEKGILKSFEIEAMSKHDHNKLIRMIFKAIKDFLDVGSPFNPK